MAKLDWRRAQLYRRRTTDYRFENDLSDTADHWLAAVERRQTKRRQRPRKPRSFSFLPAKAGR